MGYLEASTPEADRVRYALLTALTGEDFPPLSPSEADLLLSMVRHPHLLVWDELFRSPHDCLLAALTCPSLSRDHLWDLTSLAFTRLSSRPSSIIRSLASPPGRDPFVAEVVGRPHMTLRRDLPFLLALGPLSRTASLLSVYAVHSRLLRASLKDRLDALSPAQAELLTRLVLDESSPTRLTPEVLSSLLDMASLLAEVSS